jgi:hypothetical protein
MAKKKGLERGGTLGQEGELTKDPVSERGGGDANPEGTNDRLGQRDQQKQRGGIGREPSLEEKQKIQPTHEVD